jgi:hypothetical protein
MTYKNLYYDKELSTENYYINYNFEEEKNRYEDYLNKLNDIIHINYVPLKYMIDIYKKQRGNDITDKTIMKNILLYLKEILLIEKKNNKWICSKEKSDFINLKDFKLLNLYAYNKKVGV